MEEFKNKDDFAVVLQTFTEHLKFPVNRFNTTDLSYLSLDCFHFSQKGYARGENITFVIITIISDNNVCSIYRSIHKTLNNFI